MFSVCCGNMSTLGFVWIQWIPNIYWIIFFSLLTLREVSNRVGRFCNLFGSAVFMCFGMKWIAYCFLIKLNLLCSFWKMSKLLLWIGWKLKIFVLLLVTICCGSNFLSVWALVDGLFCNYWEYLVVTCYDLLCTSSVRE